jgi:SAM-dependent methyltransferase
LASPYTFKASPYSSHSKLLELLPPAEGRRVLDIGCGPGYLCQALRDRGYEVTGIERAGWGPPEGANGFTLVEADLETGLPPLDGRFDAIVCADVLEHLRDPLTLSASCAAETRWPADRMPPTRHLYFRLCRFPAAFQARQRACLIARVHFLTDVGWASLSATAASDIPINN